MKFSVVTGDKKIRIPKDQIWYDFNTRFGVMVEITPRLVTRMQCSQKQVRNRNMITM